MLQSSDEPSMRSSNIIKRRLPLFAFLHFLSSQHAYILPTCMNSCFLSIAKAPVLPATLKDAFAPPRAIRPFPRALPDIGVQLVIPYPWMKLLWLKKIDVGKYYKHLKAPQTKCIKQNKVDQAAHWSHYFAT